MRATVFFVLGLIALTSATKEVNVFAELESN
jgi:hypothetical protein